MPNTITKDNEETWFITITKFIIWVNMFMSTVFILLGLYFIFVQPIRNENNDNKNNSDNVVLGSWIVLFSGLSLCFNYFILLKYVNNDIVKVFVWLSLFSYFWTPNTVQIVADDNKKPKKPKRNSN